MTIHDLPPVLTLGEAALFLRLSRRAVLDAVHAGELPVVQLSPQILVDTARLLEELGVRVDGSLRPDPVELGVAG